MPTYCLHFLHGGKFPALLSKSNPEERIQPPSSTTKQKSVFGRPNTFECGRIHSNLAEYIRTWPNTLAAEYTRMKKSSEINKNLAWVSLFWVIVAQMTTSSDILNVLPVLL